MHDEQNDDEGEDIGNNDDENDNSNNLPSPAKCPSQLTYGFRGVGQTHAHGT